MPYVELVMPLFIQLCALTGPVIRKLVQQCSSTLAVVVVGL